MEVHIERLPLCAALCAAIALWALFLGWRYPKASRKGRLSLSLHALAALLLALAAGALSITAVSDRRAAFVLVDVSASASPAEEDILTAARTALSAAPEGMETGVIVFGKDAQVELPLGERAALGSVRASVSPDGSDLSAALALAGALLPSDAAASVAVISDGLVETPNAAGLAERGIPVSALKISPKAAADAQVSRVEVPSIAYQGQSFPVAVTVDSSAEGRATLLLYANRSLMDSREVTLRKGENRFVFTDLASSSGVIAYEAQVLLPGDGVAANNRMGAYMAVKGAPKVLLAEGTSGEGRELEKLLAAAGMDCRVASARSLPESAADYRAYHAICLCNVDADSLTDRQLAALREAVRTLGRGLCVFGGGQSYALGGYRGSELEDLLPVAMDVKSTLDVPSLALILALDKSGSMTEGRFGVTRLEVAKEAAARAAEVLLPTDEIGVIAFDDAAQWVVRLQKAENLEAIERQIGTIRPGGGTAFYSPLMAALEALKQSGAARKHVIFLTDGEPGDQGFDSVVRDMAQAGVTLTTVAVGTGANQRLLLSMAEEGGGRAWSANEFDNVPKIFTKETMLISGAYIQNRTFTPVVTDAGRLTDFAGFPTLSGYLGTTEKPEATVALESDRGDPILAWWQAGAGRVVCWTSDIAGAWTEHFLAWKEAAAFFGGVVSHALPGDEQDGRMEERDGTIYYTAPDAREEGRAEATVILPGGQVEKLEMTPVSPDTFAAALPDAGSGAYAVSVAYMEGDAVLSTLEGGAVKTYSREYDLRLTAGNALETLAAQTGGRMALDPKELLLSSSAPARAHRDLTLPLAAAALLVFVLDAAQRRLPWEKLLGKKEERQPFKQPSAAPARPKKEKSAPAPGGQTADALWQAMQKKKRM